MKETYRKKQVFFKVLALTIAIGISAGTWSCSKETGEDPIVTAVSLEAPSNSAVIGEPLRLNTTISPEGSLNNSLIWLSSDETIATVSEGIVTGISSGVVTITAISKANSAIRDAVTLEIISAPIPATAIVITSPSSTLGVGSTLQLTASVTPTNATSTTVIWNVSDPSKATVDDAGLVTGIALGSVTVTATLEDDPSLVDAIPLDIPNSIISFTFEEMESVQPVINGTDIEFVVDFNGEFKDVDVAALTPIITHNGSFVDPPSGVVQDFRGGPVTYRLFLEDNTVFNYTVSVKQDLETTFLTVWSTPNIVVNTNPDLAYNYNVDFDADGFIDITGITGNTTINNPEGTVLVISGRFPAIVANSNDLTRISIWGTVEWLSMDSAFENCTNATETADDAPNLSRVSTLRDMFRNAGRASPDLRDWDISRVTNASNMLNNSGISLRDYENALIRFADHIDDPNNEGLTLPLNINLGSVPVKACSNEAITAKNRLEANGWIINENSSFNCP